MQYIGLAIRIVCTSWTSSNAFRKFSPFCRMSTWSWVSLHFNVSSTHSSTPTSDHEVSGPNPAGGEILSEPNRRFIAQSPSCSPFHHPDMTEKLLTRTRSPKPSIHHSSPKCITKGTQFYFTLRICHIHHHHCEEIARTLTLLQVLHIRTINFAILTGTNFSRMWWQQVWRTRSYLSHR